MRFLLVSLLLLSSNDPQHVSHHKPNYGNSNHGPTQVSLAVVDAYPIVGQWRSEGSGTNKKQEPTQDKWITRFTGVLACVAVLQLIAMIAQFIAMHRQAEYLQNAERAWIVIGCPMSKNFILKNGEWDDARYVWHITNVGKTPATVTEVGAVFEMLKQPSDLPETMTVKAWTESVARKAVIVPNDTLPVGIRFKPDARIRATEVASMRSSPPQRFLVAYGYVKYLDAFTKPHETRFIHSYIVPPKDDRFGWEGFFPYGDAPDDYYKRT